MRQPCFTCIAWAALTGALLAPFPASTAAAQTFMPRIVNTEGTLEIDASSQTNAYTQGNSTTTFTGRFMGERLDLAADGYVYHPRFQIFMLRLLPTMNQSYLSEGDTVDRSSKGTMDYEFRTTFLPEHPYNLELYALHHESPGPGAAFKGRTMPMDEYGALFNYKDNPFFFSANYDNLTLHSPQNRTDTESYRASGSYAGKVLTHTASYSHSDSTSSNALHVTRETYGYGNLARVADIRLDSRVDWLWSEQQQASYPSYQTDMFTWTEQLTAPLPGNLRAEMNFRYMDENDRTGEDPAAGLPATEVFNRSTGSSFNLNHQLYNSLTTNLSLNKTSISSSSGDISSWSETLGSNYVKLIPRGLLNLGIQLGRAEVDRDGTPAIVNETHVAPLLGNFLLNQLNIVQGSITVLVKDPPTGSFLTLPSSNYAVTYLGLSVQITILNVSPATLQPDPAYLYEFHVSYSLANQSTIETSFAGFSIRAKLWDGLLGPYYSLFSSDQRMVVGAIPGGTDQYTNQIAGVATQSGPFSAFVERQSYRSRLNPSETWRAQMQNRFAPGPSTNLSVLLSYLRTDHLASSSVPASTAYQETTSGVDLNLDMKFPQANVSFLWSGSYYTTNSVIDSNTLITNSSLIWSIGLLSVNAGGQLYRLESLPATGRVAYVTQYYYVMVQRKLF